MNKHRIFLANSLILLINLAFASKQTTLPSTELQTEVLYSLSVPSQIVTLPCLARFAAPSGTGCHPFLSVENMDGQISAKRHVYSF
jgi:hypothetical protein